MQPSIECSMPEFTEYEADAFYTHFEATAELLGIKQFKSSALKHAHLRDFTKRPKSW